MSRDLQPAQELLSAKGRQVLASIADPRARAEMSRSIDACAAALAVVDGFDISRYELIDLNLPDLDVWSAAAPGVRDVLVAVCRSLEVVSEVFPPEGPTMLPTSDLMDDLELAFETFELEEDHPRVRDGEEVDRLVERGRADAAPAVASLVAMLRHEIFTFGRSLTNPGIVADRWQLFGELQEFKAKCTQCLDAIPAAILAPFSSANPEELLPRYLTELQRSRRLRAALVDLSHDINRMNRDLEKADETRAAEVRRAASVRLQHFAELSPYQYLWPRDKRVIILFQASLNRRPRPTLVEQRREMEGFSKFLETLRAINHRPELEASDAQHLAAALSLLRLGLSEQIALVHIELVYGRNARLDGWLRARRRANDSPDEPLTALVEQAVSAMPKAAALIPGARLGAGRSASISRAASREHSSRGQPSITADLRSGH